MFNTLHTLFEAQHTELALAVDEIAERLRALDARAPGSFAEFAELSVIEESGESVPARCWALLAADPVALAGSAREVVMAANVAQDLASADLGTRRIEVHEKNAWMLRSHLE